MTDQKQQTYQKVLIASANPLFGKGLEKMVLRQWGEENAQIRHTSNMADTVREMEVWQPELVIVDYDDKTISRAAFLQEFVSGDLPMQVMLVSLQASGEVVVYDRRTITPAQAEDWLYLSSKSKSAPEEPTYPKRRQSMKHFAIVGVLVAVLSVAVYFVLSNIGLLPIDASVQAQPIDRLFNIHLIAISFLFSLIVVFMVYSLVVFRRKAGEEGDGAYFKGSNPLEAIWTIVPLGVVIYFSYLGSVALAETRKVDTGAIEIKVVGGQWFWRFEYPEYGIVSDKMYMPVNQQALLKLTSVDVIHSFWVPEFRVKQDLLPGENLVRELRVTPNQVGEFKVRCAEMCGTSHAYMESPVIVVSQEEFDAWVAEEMKALGADPAERGARFAKNNGCLSCHSVDGTPGVGPTWQGLFGKENELLDGTKVLVDDEYLLNAIINPNIQVAKGFSANVMPQNYSATISEQQINDIIAYIKTLN